MVQVGDIVKYANHNWYVIKVEKGIVTLLVKDTSFGEHAFDTHCNEYKTSEIRAYLNSTILRSIEGANGNPLLTKLSDVGCTDKVWLLSINQAKRLPKAIKACTVNGCRRSWWLRSCDSNTYSAANDYYGCSVQYIYYNVNRDSNIVRPAIRVKAEELAG